jgi:type III secretion system YscQ/HrcQ family protein
MTEPKELKLPKLPLNLVRLLNRLAARTPNLPLALPGGNSPAFWLRPLLSGVEYCGPEDRPAPTAPGEVEFALHAENDLWRIRVRGAVAEALLAPPEGLGMEDIPEELRPACLALALEPMLDSASARLGKQFRLAAGEDGALPALNSAESFVLPFVLERPSGERAGTGWARLPLSIDAMSLLADVVKTLPRRVADASGIPVSLSLCAAKENVSLGLLRRAEAGDVLLLETPSAPPLTLEGIGQSLWSVTLANGVITLKNALHNVDKEALMNSDTEERPAPAGGSAKAGLSPAALDALEVTLTLELEERRISVGELAALAPGHTLESTASLEAPVTLKVGDRAIGKGRLVEVGGRLGVLISSLDISGRAQKDC